MRPSKEARRPSLATIVGSGLAVVAAGSLLAFSSLAEQAGLQGLATGGLQPAQPDRGGTTHAITVPAPSTATPGDPRDELTRRVREAITRTEAEPERVTVAFDPEPRQAVAPKPKPQPKSQPNRPRPVERSARVAVDPPDETEPASDGPPYGHAYGHHKNKAKPKKKHEPKPPASQQPVYARKANDEPKAKGPKPPKTKKVEKAPEAKGNGKAKGHSKHGHSNGKGNGHSKHGHSNGKGNGHSKHGHSNGKGKGHSKHGH